jgi:hypothetical protein
VLLFAGPTLSRARLISAALPLDGIELEPPIRRGDLPRVTRRRVPGVMAIVDGVFHDALAVGHAEIRRVLEAGWHVYGLASMGAIRAREMHHLGMRGFGRVFARYCEPGDFRDDEVALLHEPEPPYRELSEPLVHLRAALASLSDVVPAADAQALLDELDGMWFGERSAALVVARLSARCPEARARIAATFAELDRFRWKALDLIDFLVQQPWLAHPSHERRDHGQ